jgi:hypothetical protein
MSRATAFLVVLITAIATDLLIPFLLATRYPGYSHLRDTISALGAPGSPVQRYQSAALILVGSLLLVFAIGQGLSFQVIRWSHILFLLGIVLFGFGSILAGVFPQDPAGAAETISGKIHGIASGLGFLFLILNPLWALWIDEFSRLRVINAILFAAAILSFAVFLAFGKSTDGAFPYTGLFQRLNLAILYAHLLLNFLWQKR